MKKNLLIIFIYALIVKLLYVIFSNLYGYYTCSWEGLTNVFYRWDSGWYREIAEQWYPKQSVEEIKTVFSRWPFFPLYPFLNRLLIQIFSISFKDSALIWSVILSTTSFYGFHAFVNYYMKDLKKSLYITLVFISMPFNYYYSMFLTEATFFTVLIFSFVSILYNKKYLIGIFAALLVLSRPSGIVLLGPIYLFFLEKNYNGIKTFLDKKALFSKKHIQDFFIVLLLPVATFILYCGYQYIMTEDFKAFATAQNAWGREFRLPTLFQWIQNFPTAFYIIFMMIISFINRKKIPLSLNIFIWFSMLYPLFSGSLMGMNRYISTIFPLFIILGSYLYRFKAKYTIVGILLLVQMLVFYSWIIHHLFSI